MDIRKYLNKKQILLVALLLPVLVNILYLLFTNFSPISKFGMEENYYYLIGVYSHYPKIPSDSIVDRTLLGISSDTCYSDDCSKPLKYSDIDLSSLSTETKNNLVGMSDLYINLENKNCGPMSAISKQYPDSKYYGVRQEYLLNIDLRFPGYASNFFQVKIREDVEVNSSNNDSLRKYIKDNCNIEDPSFTYYLVSKYKFYGK